MATLDDLEATVKPVEQKEANCDPCKVPSSEKVCANCCFCGQTEPKRTFKNDVGQAESMRYCYNFLEFVPARPTFGCTMFYKGSRSDK